MSVRHSAATAVLALLIVVTCSACSSEGESAGDAQAECSTQGATAQIRTYQSRTDQDEEVPGDVDEDGELDDGTYDAEVQNITQANGPYVLEVEKDGSDVTIHFANGGYIVTYIDSQGESVGTWLLETTHLSAGDSWEISIDP